MLAMFQQSAVVFGPGSPSPVVAAIGKLPHHAGQKAAGPIGPKLTLMLPAAVDRVNWKVIRRAFDDTRDLALRKVESGVVFGRARIAHHDSEAGLSAAGTLNRASILPERVPRANDV